MRGKEKAVYSYECGEESESHQQRHHNLIWQGKAENLRLISPAAETKSNIVIQPAGVSATSETKKRCKTHRAKTETHDMGVPFPAKQSILM